MFLGIQAVACLRLLFLFFGGIVFSGLFGVVLTWFFDFDLVYVATNTMFNFVIVLYLIGCVLISLGYSDFINPDSYTVTL